MNEDELLRDDFMHYDQAVKRFMQEKSEGTRSKASFKDYKSCFNMLANT